MSFLLVDQHSSGLLRKLSSTSNFAIDATGFLRQLSSTIIFGGLVNHLLMDQYPFLLVDQHSSGLLRKLSSTSNFAIDATGFLRQLSSTIIFGGLVNHLLMDQYPFK